MVSESFDLSTTDPTIVKIGHSKNSYHVKKRFFLDNIIINPCDIYCSTCLNNLLWCSSKTNNLLNEQTNTP